MKRRSFIRHVSHGLAVPGVLGTMGFNLRNQSLEMMLRLASSTDKVLVMIFLEGGNDGLNTVVPLDQLSNLNKVRPHVIMPDSKLLNLEGAGVGLHPSLKGMQSLFDEKRLQIIQNVGYPDQNYSHFRSTDIWMSASDSNELVNSGWGGRMLANQHPGYPLEYPTVETPDPLAIEIGYGNSLIFQGPQSAMSMVISDPEFFYKLVENEEQEAPNTPAGDKLRYIRLIAAQSQQYGKTVKEAAAKVKSQSAYPDTYISQQLKIVSRLIAGGLKTPLYMIRHGGFDTHDAQVDTTDHTKGEHSDLLRELDEGIMAFTKDLEKQGTEDRVMGMTFSEFGRRVVSNASLGTDHGAAAPLFIFGNAVKGGITGTNPEISINATYEDNLPWEFDFRQIYASILSQWFELDDNQVAGALTREFETIDVIKSTSQLSAIGELAGLKVYPNPMIDLVNIQLPAVNDNVTVALVDLSGRITELIYQGQVSESKTISWNASRLEKGRYLITMRGTKTHQVFSVIKK